MIILFSNGLFTEPCNNFFRVLKYWEILTFKMRLVVFIVQLPNILQPTLQTIHWKFTYIGEAKVPQQYLIGACMVH